MAGDILSVDARGHRKLVAYHWPDAYRDTKVIRISLIRQGSTKAFSCKVPTQQRSVQALACAGLVA